MVSVNHYFEEIDVLKGIAILLIIFGHCFCEYPVNFGETNLTILQHFCLSFHLNLFFVASGILFSFKTQWGLFIRKKTKRLLIPWGVFTLVALFLKIMFSNFTHGQVGSIHRALLLDLTCGNSYWFIYALFIMMVTTKMIKNLRVFILICISLFIIQYYLRDFKPEYNILCFTRVVHFYPWFLLGVIIKNYYSTASDYLKTSPQINLTAGFSILLAMLVLLITGWSRIFVVSRYVMPLLGCIATWHFSFIICKKGRINKCFTFFGKYSLQFYLNHLLIMLCCYYLGAQVFYYSHTLALFTIFLSALLFSMFMFWLEMKLKPISFLFGFL